jgi:predicted DNA-binding transcriptional regulator AlpA
MSKSVAFEIDEERKYNIQEVALLTGYSTSYLRNLEFDKKIPSAERDDNGWRVWLGSDVEKIMEYKQAHVKTLSQKTKGKE